MFAFKFTQGRCGTTQTEGSGAGSSTAGTRYTMKDLVFFALPVLIGRFQRRVRPQFSGFGT